MTSWRTWSRSQVVCRGAVALLPGLVLVIGPVRPNALVVGLVVAGSMLWAAWPELAAGPAVLLLVMGWWALAVPDPVQPRVVGAAAALHTAHLAALLAAYGPPRAAIDPQLAITWIRRGLLSFLAVPLAYLSVIGLDRVPDPPLMWPVAVAGLVAVSLVLGLQLRDDTAG